MRDIDMQNIRLISNEPKVTFVLDRSLNATASNPVRIQMVAELVLFLEDILSKLAKERDVENCVVITALYFMLLSTLVEGANLVVTLPVSRN